MFTLHLSGLFELRVPLRRGTSSGKTDRKDGYAPEPPSPDRREAPPGCPATSRNTNKLGEKLADHYRCTILETSYRPQSLRGKSITGAVRGQRTSGWFHVRNAPVALELLAKTSSTDSTRSLD